MAVTDRVTVMRKGIVTGILETKNTNENELANLMVGREINLKITKKSTNFGEPVLQVKGLSVMNHRGRLAVKDVSFNVKKGEILGVCGVEGNGQSELINAITGLCAVEKGEIRIYNKDIQSLSVRKRRQCGMAHIPEDRLKLGCAKSCSIKENLILNCYYQKGFSFHGFLNKQRIEVHAAHLIERFLIKTPNADYNLGVLSGGNMQKVILAREIDADPDIMITAQPTRGVDIGAIEYIRREIVKLRDMGKAILLISAELEEILTLSDRIIVLYEGEVAAELQPEHTTEEELGLYMSGAKRMDFGEKNA
jgi:simple sugar transport system ATP-binding protein